MDDEVDPREVARMRRRDRDASAEARDLLRPGMGKVFKQIQDSQRRAAGETSREAAESDGAPPTTSCSRRKR